MLCNKLLHEFHRRSGAMSRARQCGLVSRSAGNRTSESDERADGYFTQSQLHWMEQKCSGQISGMKVAYFSQGLLGRVAFSRSDFQNHARKASNKERSTEKRLSTSKRNRYE